jgi:glucokinase
LQKDVIMNGPIEHDCVLGVEIGGSKLQAAVGTREGEILDLRTARADPKRGAPGIRSQIEALVRPLLKSAGRRPEAIGVGFGGPVETATGTVLVSHQVEGWKDFALRPWFEERFGLPCLVENDSNCAGLAEHRRGAGRGTRNMVYMNIGSGIGGAIILNGELYNGQGRGAGEIGHTWVPNLWGQPTQRPDREGGPETPDKLELLCSGWAIEQRLREVAAIPAGTPLHALTGGLPDRITGPIVAQAAARGDRLVLDRLDRISDMLGLAMANVITLFHPERYVIGGGFAQLGAPLFDRLRASVDRYVFGPFKGRYEILPAQLEQTVVIVGALLIAPRS